jgi:hypothetical protein
VSGSRLRPLSPGSPMWRKPSGGVSTTTRQPGWRNNASSMCGCPAPATATYPAGKGSLWIVSMQRTAALGTHRREDGTEVVSAVGDRSVESAQVGWQRNAQLLLRLAQLRFGCRRVESKHAGRSSPVRHQHVEVGTEPCPDIVRGSSSGVLVLPLA